MEKGWQRKHPHIFYFLRWLKLSIMHQNFRNFVMTSENTATSLSVTIQSMFTGMILARPLMQRLSVSPCIIPCKGNRHHGCDDR